MNRVPQRIGNVEIHDTLGRGGMGVVYVGTQTLLERPVVVKGLRGDATGDPALLQRFQREAQAASTIQHANVVAVHDAFEWRGQPWIVQEFVDGEDLARVIGRQGPLPHRIAALVTLSIVSGLEEVHDRGIVHRDLKPSNVLLGRKGDVKVCDFGIALDHNGPGLTRTGYAIGTVPYMAPEQMLGEVVDARSDLFAVGVLLYEMLCGCVPFPAHDPNDESSLVRRIQGQRYARVHEVRRGVPRWLRQITERCLRAKPRRRSGSTTDLRRELEKHLDHPSPADVRAEIAGYLAPTWQERLEVVESEVEIEGTTRPVARADSRPVPSPGRRAVLVSGAVGAVAAVSWWLWTTAPVLGLGRVLRLALGG